jgi:hypothetical protein
LENKKYVGSKHTAREQLHNVRVVSFPFWGPFSVFEKARALGASVATSNTHAQRLRKVSAVATPASRSTRFPAFSSQPVHLRLKHRTHCLMRHRYPLDHLVMPPLTRHTL